LDDDLLHRHHLGGRPVDIHGASRWRPGSPHAAQQPCDLRVAERRACAEAQFHPDGKVDSASQLLVPRWPWRGPLVVEDRQHVQRQHEFGCQKDGGLQVVGVRDAQQGLQPRHHANMQWRQPGMVHYLFRFLRWFCTGAWAFPLATSLAEMLLQQVGSPGWLWQVPQCWARRTLQHRLDHEM
jgi:hypothetical protein